MSDLPRLDNGIIRGRRPDGTEWCYAANLVERQLFARVEAMERVLRMALSWSGDDAEWVRVRSEMERVLR